jgi:iron complex transport system substrate-binding protein
MRPARKPLVARNMAIVFFFGLLIVVLSALQGLDSESFSGVSHDVGIEDTDLSSASCTSITPSSHPRATPSTPQTPIVITDASGKEIRLPSLPQRLAVVGRGPQYLLHLLYMFPEGPERLVGMEQRGKTASDFLTALFPGIDAKLTLLPNPGPEAVAGLEPDLVLMKGTGADPLADALAKVGIPTAFLNLETPEEYYRDIANLGVLLGNKAQADRIIAFYRKNVVRVEEALSGLADDDRPSVLVAMGNMQRGKYAVRVPALPWMQTYQVRAGGGRPVWLDAAERAGGWAVVNLEQIAAWDPDRIVFIVWYSIEASAFMDWLASDRQWKNIRAVREGNVHYFPTDFYGWDTPDVRWILGLTWMAASLHPERFPDYDIADEVRSFYGELYGLDAATIDAEIVPRIKTDFR